MAAYKLNVGDSIPSFKAYDSQGSQVTREELLGNPLVIYFYPKDDTPGCTKEACSFRDNMEHLQDLNATVIGISPDSDESHNRFREKYDLNFTLLCDENKELSRKFDVLRNTPPSLERTTFVIDSKGVIRWIERPVNVDGHTERVIHAVNALKENKK